MDFLQNEIVLGVLVFTIAVNMMVFVILGARKLLVSSAVNMPVYTVLLMQLPGPLIL